MQKRRLKSLKLNVVEKNPFGFHFLASFSEPDVLCPLISFFSLLDNNLEVVKRFFLWSL